MSVTPAARGSDDPESFRNLRDDGPRQWAQSDRGSRPEVRYTCKCAASLNLRFVSDEIIHLLLGG